MEATSEGRSPSIAAQDDQIASEADVELLDGSPSRERLPLADLPTDDASIRVREWAVAHAERTPSSSAASVEADARSGAAVRSSPRNNVRLSQDDGASDGAGSRFRGAGRSFAYEELQARSEDDGSLEGSVPSPSRRYYDGEVNALEESQHEGVLGLDLEPRAGLTDGGHAHGAHAKAKPKAKPQPPTRPWLRIGDDGELRKLTTNSKYKAAHKLGVKPRDLRFLELPTLTLSPPALLARENAIVVCFESIRCIITLNCVYIVNPEDDRTHSLVDELNTQLRSHAPMGLTKNKAAYSSVSKLSDIAGRLRLGRGIFGLPFELKALEVCFDRLVSELSAAAGELEREALLALDKLTQQVRMPELEAVRRIKNKLVRLKKRIESIHGVIERFLDDDEDMHRLNLTAEELARQASEAEAEQRGRSHAQAHTQSHEDDRSSHEDGRSSQTDGEGTGEVGAPPPAAPMAAATAPCHDNRSAGHGTTLATATPSPGPSSARLGALGMPRNMRRFSHGAVPPRLSSTREEEDGETDDGAASPTQLPPKRSGASRSRSTTSSSSHSSSSFNSEEEAEVAEVEMLLEAYDMHLEHALGRLQTLDEYIQDTEDLVNTSLDQKRNELISCDVLLTSNIVALGLMSTISSFMAMNLVPTHLMEHPYAFDAVAVASSVGVYLLWGVFLVWALKQNLVRF